MGAPASGSQDIKHRTELSCSSLRVTQRTAKAPRYSMRRAERYREAEARLLKSFRHCQQEPSARDLQLRALERAKWTLSQLAEESGRDAKKLKAKTIDRATIASLDSGSYTSILSQRWRAERRRDLISHHIEVLEQTLTSLNSSPSPLKTSSGAEIALPQGGHEDNQVPDPEDKTYANLVSFLGCPQRVVPLRYSSRSRSHKIYFRPLHLKVPSIVVPTSITNSLITTTTTAQTDSSSDSSLDMHVQTPVVTDSLAGQQAQLKLLINEGQAGTAIIHSRPLPPAVPLDPSNVEVELPDYVHELLADFDAQGNALPSTTAFMEFQRGELPKKSRSRGLWPFGARYKDRGPKTVTSQPELRTKSSLKRLSGLLSASEMLTLRRKMNLKEVGGSLTTISGTKSEEDGDSASRGRNSPPARMVAKVTSKFGRRISVVPSKR